MYSAERTFLCPDGEYRLFDFHLKRWALGFTSSTFLPRNESLSDTWEIILGFPGNEKAGQRQLHVRSCTPRVSGDISQGQPIADKNYVVQIANSPFEIQQLFFSIKHCLAGQKAWRTSRKPLLKSSTQSARREPPRRPPEIGR